MNDDLRALAFSAAGGEQLWKSLQLLKIDISIGGPFWAMKGWPPGTSFDQTMLLDTTRQHIVFVPFVQPDHRMVFDAASDTVRLETLEGRTISTLRPARAAFTGLQRSSAWDTLHVGYFLGYACWNYFTTPFIFAFPGVETREIEVWHERGQPWRRLSVDFPKSIATHSRSQIFYFDSKGVQRRMDYTVDVGGGNPVSHYTGGYRNFGGLEVATRRLVFPRNLDNTADLDHPSITMSIRDVQLVRR